MRTGAACAVRGEGEAMTKPLIYVSYGMAKSGSTLGFQLLTAILEEAGVPQNAVDMSQTIGGQQERFIGVIRPAELKQLIGFVVDGAPFPLSVKTHGGLWDCVRRGLDNGLIRAHAICRDPRDIALSMMDASRENRAWGKRDGQPLRHIEDALDTIRAQVEKFETWASHPSVMTIPYERLAFDTKAIADDIAAQLDVEVDAARCVKAAKATFTQFNKGVPRRHETELAEDVAASVGEEFRAFIDQWCAPDFRAKRPGLLDRIIKR